MFWSTGLILVLAVSQVPAEFAKPEFIENVIGDASATSQRIVSGWAASPGQFPYQTSLRMVNSAGGVSGCGGSVVSREWIITAAHCTANQITIVVRAGLVSLTTPEYIFETQQWYNHPTYNDHMAAVVQPNDISILKLQRPVKYTNNLQPIRVQQRVEAFRNYDREIVIASGFGRTWTLGSTSEVLNWVYLRAVSNQACERTFGTALITANAICAGFYNVTSQSTCQGDSGGPLVHVNSDGIPTLIGVASFVAGGDFGCHSGLPAGFIRTGPFHAWFEQVTGIDFENLDEEEEVTTLQPTVPTTPEPPTTTPEPSTTTPQPLTTTPEPPTTTPELPATTPEPPTTTPELPATTPEPPTTTPELPATTPEPPTTLQPPTTPEPEEESEEDDSSEEEDAEVSELLKKLIVQVKVKININSKPKKKVKCTN